jgi:ribosome-binding protein aMBF1 (putative translation factor)
MGREHKDVRLTIDGKEYVAIPRAEYLRMTGRDLDGAVNAAEYARASLGSSLRAAREHVGLTQAELAVKLGKTQPMVSAAESGAAHVGARYAEAVLKACRLPKDWKAPRRKKTGGAE